jgi:hypothetical protein
MGPSLLGRDKRKRCFTGKESDGIFSAYRAISTCLGIRGGEFGFGAVQSASVVGFQCWQYLSVAV